MERLDELERALASAPREPSASSSLPSASAPPLLADAPAMELTLPRDDDVPPLPPAHIAAMHESADEELGAKAQPEMIDEDDVGPAAPGSFAGSATVDGRDMKRKALPSTAPTIPRTRPMPSAPPRTTVATGTIRPPQPSMVPNDNPLPLIEATLVPDGGDETVYDAIPLRGDDPGPWWKRRRGFIVGGAGLLAGLSIAVAVVGVTSSNTGDDAASNEIDETLSGVPAANPADESDSPFAGLSTALPSTPPSFEPSVQPTFYPRLCFEDREELRAAIDKYYDGGVRCSVENDCAVTDKYGWPIGTWCVSKITDMSGLFNGWRGSAREDLTHWDVSSVTSMNRMFEALDNFNGDISRWNTSSLEDMGGMFGDAISFNGNLNGWDVSRVTSMSSTFNRAKSFNGDLSQWNTSSVLSMSGMFSYATEFNRDVSHFDISSVTDMDSIFRGAAKFNQSMCSWEDAWAWVEDPRGGVMNPFWMSGCEWQGIGNTRMRHPSCARCCVRYCSQ